MRRQRIDSSLDFALKFYIEIIDSLAWFASMVLHCYMFFSSALVHIKRNFSNRTKWFFNIEDRTPILEAPS